MDFSTKPTRFKRAKDTTGVRKGVSDAELEQQWQAKQDHRDVIANSDRKYRQEAMFRDYLKASSKAALGPKQPKRGPGGRVRREDSYANFLYLSRPTKASQAQRRDKYDLAHTPSFRSGELKKSSSRAKLPEMPDFMRSAQAAQRTAEFIAELEAKSKSPHKVNSPFGTGDGDQANQKSRSRNGQRRRSSEGFPQVITAAARTLEKMERRAARARGPPRSPITSAASPSAAHTATRATAAAADQPVKTRGGAVASKPTTGLRRTTSKKTVLLRPMHQPSRRHLLIRQNTAASAASLSSSPRIGRTQSRRDIPILWRQATRSSRSLMVDTGASGADRRGVYKAATSASTEQLDSMAGVAMSPRAQDERRSTAFKALRAREDRIPFTNIVDVATPARGLPRTSSLSSLGSSGEMTTARLSTTLAQRNALRSLKRGMKANPALSRAGQAAMIMSPVNTRRAAGLSKAQANITATVQAARAEGVMPEPVAMGMVRSRTHVLNLRDYGIGDRVASVLASAEFDEDLVQVDLACNRLSTRASMALIDRIPPSSLRRLDISFNRVGRPGATALRGLLQRAGVLCDLFLEQCQLDDNSMAMLMGGVEECPSLRCLVLSGNPFHDKGAHAVAAAVSSPNCRLNKLDLSWCNLMGAGAVAVVDAVRTNTTIQTLDLSWNALGSSIDKPHGVPRSHPGETDVTKLLADVFKHNTTLLHLDLRHNHIGAALVPRLASAFAANHTIRGLHCDGNAMRIDARGFMQVCSNGHLEDADGAGGGLLGGRIVQRDMRQDTGATGEATRVEGSRFRHHGIGAFNGRAWLPLEMNRDNCWVCGQWRAHTFRYESPGSFQAAYEVSLRASIDEWCVDVPMPKLGSTDSEEATFELRRMVPREAVEYKFTIVPCQPPTPITTHATDRPSRRSLSDNAVRPVRGSTALAGERPIVNWVEETKKPAAGRWSDVINAPDAVLPRSSDFIPASRKTAWSLPISVFAGYKPVSDATVQQCCDVDWNCSKLSKFIKEPEEQRAVKAVMQRHYRAVMQVFKQASALDHTAFSLSMNTFTDFFKECKVPDRETCKLQELDTVFIASNVVSSSTKGRRRSLLPARSAVRFQFLEALVRVAKAKFIASGATSSISEAVRMLLELHVLPHAEVDPLGPRFEERRLHNEPVDLVFKRCLPALQRLFDAYAGRFTEVKVFSNGPKFMSIHDALGFAVASGLCHDSGDAEDGAPTPKHATAAPSAAATTTAEAGGVPQLGERVVKMAFVHSTQTVVDELQSHRHRQLSFVQFLTFLGRIAEHSDGGSRDCALVAKLEPLLAALLRVHANREGRPSGEEQGNGGARDA